MSKIPEALLEMQLAIRKEAESPERKIRAGCLREFAARLGYKYDGDEQLYLPVEVVFFSATEKSTQIKAWFFAHGGMASYEKLRERLAALRIVIYELSGEKNEAKKAAIAAENKAASHRALKKIQLMDAQKMSERPADAHSKDEEYWKLVDAFAEADSFSATCDALFFHMKDLEKTIEAEAEERKWSERGASKLQPAFSAQNN